MMRIVKVVVLFLMSMGALGTSAWAQSATASILGQVIDPTGAAIANAKATPM